MRPLNGEAARRMRRRIAKAERRMARGVDTRSERDALVSERAIAERLRRLLRGEN